MASGKRCVQNWAKHHCMIKRKGERGEQDGIDSALCRWEEKRYSLMHRKVEISQITHFPNCVKTSWHAREGYFTSYHGLPYIISNLPMWTFTMLKNVRIGSCMWAGKILYKFTLGYETPCTSHTSQKSADITNNNIVIWKLPQHWSISYISTTSQQRLSESIDSFLLILWTTSCLL